MKQAVRAIIVRDKKLLTMKRDKFGQKYYTLIGGHVGFGEGLEHALVREVREETGLQLKKFRLVFVEEAGAPYGTQFIYLCEDPGGEVIMPTDSDEAKISAMGKNIYEPKWVSLERLDEKTFRSENLKKVILHAIKVGFPDQPHLIGH